MKKGGKINKKLNSLNKAVKQDKKKGSSPNRVGNFLEKTVS